MKFAQEVRKYSEMPDWLVALFAISGLLIAGFYGFVLHEVLPGYLEIANKVPLSEWGSEGLLVTPMLAGLGVVTWHFGYVACCCNGILSERWYK